MRCGLALRLKPPLSKRSKNTIHHVVIIFLATVPAAILCRYGIIRRSDQVCYLRKTAAQFLPDRNKRCIPTRTAGNLVSESFNLPENRKRGIKIRHHVHGQYTRVIDHTFYVPALLCILLRDKAYNLLTVPSHQRVASRYVIDKRHTRCKVAFNPPEMG